MGLSKCADTQIGKAGMKKGISGGESKRLSVACEVSVIWLWSLCTHGSEYIIISNLQVKGYSCFFFSLNAEILLVNTVMICGDELKESSSEVSHMGCVHRQVAANLRRDCKSMPLIEEIDWFDGKSFRDVMSFDKYSQF